MPAEILPITTITTKRSRRRLPLVVDAARLAKLLCAGIRTVRSWDAAGILPSPIRIGGRVVWVLNGEWGIQAWLAAGAPPREEWEARKAAVRGARRNR